MPGIEFHFNAPDKPAYACRLLRKATVAGAKVVVTADHDALARLDTQLWTFSQIDFIPHVHINSSVSAEQLALSPVVLSVDPAAAELPHHQVLLNLGDEMPSGFERYERIIEVVSLDETDRQHARGRWKAYVGLGHTITRQDLNLKS